jgi:hypothetical protein
VSGEENAVSVSGGGTPSKVLSRPISVGGSPVFGLEDFEMFPEEEGGGLDVRAGSHPLQLTTVVTLNQTAGAEPVKLPKDLFFALPPGLVGNPTPFLQCTDAQFDTQIENGGPQVNECPAASAVGVAVVTVNEPSLGGVDTVVSPLFNLTPLTGEPARFGFKFAGLAPVLLDTSVRTGGDYGVTVSANNISQIPGFLSSKVTFWGVPGRAAHDPQRGWTCLYGFGACNPLGEPSPPPFLALPTSCEQPFTTTVTGDSWAALHTPSVQIEPPVSYTLPVGKLVGCNQLLLEPQISVAPDGTQASSPSGLTVGIHIPQTGALNPDGVAESALKELTVKLPPGVAVNPAGADGLQACSESQIGYLPAQSTPGKPQFTPDEPSCPDASKVGKVEVESPLLPPGHPLTGFVYLGTPAPFGEPGPLGETGLNPFGSLIALYIVAKDPVSGTLVKSYANTTLDPVTGQLVSLTQNIPELPFENLRVSFFGGENAPLGTPAQCGLYRTEALFTPWSGNPPTSSSSSFKITTGPKGGPCPPTSGLPFAPDLTAGTTSIQAGGFSPFTTTLSREDGNQDLQGVRLRMPPGLLGFVSHVKQLCEEGQANAGTCPADSLIGHTTVSVGLGDHPYTVTGGKVFLTGPYHGAPYGLSIVNPAKAGPFDLGSVIVRARIEVDPITAALTVTTDGTNPGEHPIPHMLKGIPLLIKHVNVTVDRAEFTFNPTNCEKQQIGATLTSDQGASGTLTVPFQVTGCAVLAFKPRFKVSTSGKTSRKNGASLTVKLSYPPGSFGKDANIHMVKVSLPKQLPSRLTTLQKACPDTTFNQDPAPCSQASRIGTATATTPILANSLAGPAYFVSHGGAKFPELIIVLQGNGITVNLHGETFINKRGITSSTFRQIPDVPVQTFQLNLPQGSNSALAANGNLCKAKLTMPTALTSQNGLVIRQSTPIHATGCPKAKKAGHQTHRKGAHTKK